MNGGTRKKGGKNSKSRTYKVGKDAEGGGSTSPGTLTQLSASHIPGQIGAPEPVGIDSPLTGTGAPLQMDDKSGSVAVGGKAASHTPMKVILAAAKKKKNKVILAAAKAVPASKTKKVSHAKKVRVTISNLGKKIHKAKEIRKAATESTLTDVKNTLNKAGLIKADSKAPETMLRQMYADFMTLKGRAL